MAVDFNQPASGLDPGTYLSRAGSTYTIPFTVALFFNPSVIVTSTTTLWVQENAGNGHQQFALNLDGSSGTQQVTADKENGATVARSFAGVPYTAGGWQMAGGVWASASSTLSYYAGAAGILAPDNFLPGATDTQYVGAYDFFGGFVFRAHGCLAWVTGWNGVALAAADMMAFAAGGPAAVSTPFTDCLPMAAAASVGTNTGGANFTPNAGAGSFTDCPTAPVFGGSGHSQLYEIGVARRSFAGWRRRSSGL